MSSNALLIYFLSTAGRKTLGLLSEPAVSVHALDRYVDAVNSWNQKALMHRALLNASGKAPGGSTGSASGSDSVGSAGSGGESASKPAEAEERTDVQEPDGGQSHNAEASSSSRSDHEGNSNEDTACSGPRSGAAAEHSALGDAMGSSKCSAACSDPPPKASSRKGGSRVRALLSRLRRRREKPAEQLTKNSGAADEHAEADVGPPADLELPASASPLQDSLSTAGADTAGPSTSENNPAAYTAGSASCSDGTGASGLGIDPQMTVDWGELNSSMMHSLHAIISDLITAAVAKVLNKLPCEITGDRCAEERWVDYSVRRGTRYHRTCFGVQPSCATTACW